MFRFNDKKVMLFLLAAALVVCLPSSAFAAFKSLTDAGRDILKDCGRLSIRHQQWELLPYVWVVFW